jgi:hypothetical protein
MGLICRSVGAHCGRNVAEDPPKLCGARSPNTTSAAFGRTYFTTARAEEGE